MARMFLEVSHLRVAYAGRPQPAVRDVSLGLNAGDIGVLIGPSGCGKTTLLRAVAGLEAVSGGSIQLADQVVSSTSFNLAPENRQIGMVFQDYALFPHLTIGRNVGFGIHHLATKARAARVAEVLELVGFRWSATARGLGKGTGPQTPFAAVGRTLFKLGCGFARTSGT